MGRYFQKCCDLFCGRLKCSLFLLSTTPILYGASFTKPSTNTHTQAAKNVLRMEDFLVDVRKLAEEASFLKAFYVFPAKIDFVGELCAVFTVVSVVGGSGTPELCRAKALLIGNPYPNSLLVLVGQPDVSGPHFAASHKFAKEAVGVTVGHVGEDGARLVGTSLLRHAKVGFLRRQFVVESVHGACEKRVPFHGQWLAGGVARDIVARCAFAALAPADGQLASSHLTFKVPLALLVQSRKMQQRFATWGTVAVLPAVGCAPQRSGVLHEAWQDFLLSTGLRPLFTRTDVLIICIFD